MRADVRDWHGFSASGKMNGWGIVSAEPVKIIDNNDLEILPIHNELVRKENEIEIEEQ